MHAGEVVAPWLPIGFRLLKMKLNVRITPKICNGHQNHNSHVTTEVQAPSIPPSLMPHDEF